MDRAVMNQKPVRDSHQLFHGLVILVGDGLVGAVAAGHHQRYTVHRPEQEVMEGRIGQHHPERGALRSHLVSDQAWHALAEKNDRTLRR